MQHCRKCYIFGLQRSGTNFLQNLLETNLNYRVDNITLSSDPLGVWKHRVIPPDIENIMVDDIFLILKRPLNWIESICFRSPVDIVSTQEKYQLKSTESLVIGKNNINLENLIKLYIDHFNNWIYNPPMHIKNNLNILVYEQILECQSSYLNLKTLNNLYWKFPKKVYMSKKKKNKNLSTYTNYRSSLIPSSLTEHILTAMPSYIQEYFDAKKV